MSILSPVDMVRDRLSAEPSPADVAQDVVTTSALRQHYELTGDLPVADRLTSEDPKSEEMRQRYATYLEQQQMYAGLGACYNGIVMEKPDYKKKASTMFEAGRTIIIPAEFGMQVVTMSVVHRRAARSEPYTLDTIAYRIIGDRKKAVEEVFHKGIRQSEDAFFARNTLLGGNELVIAPETFETYTKRSTTQDNPPTKPELSEREKTNLSNRLSQWERDMETWRNRKPRIFDQDAAQISLQSLADIMNRPVRLVYPYL